MLWYSRRCQPQTSHLPRTLDRRAKRTQRQKDFLRWAPSNFGSGFTSLHRKKGKGVQRKPGATSSIILRILKFSLEKPEVSSRAKKSRIDSRPSIGLKRNNIKRACNLSIYFYVPQERSTSNWKMHYALQASLPIILLDNVKLTPFTHYKIIRSIFSPTLFYVVPIVAFDTCMWYTGHN